MGMLKKTIAALCFFAVATATAEAAPLAAGEPIPPADLEAFVDGYVANAMADRHIPGVSISVVQDGQILLKKGYGFADVAAGRSVDPDTTLFRIGSISKTFTHIALMKRVEDGKIGLDDPINDHLPPALRIPDEGFREPIRIRHIFTHQAGFEDRTLSGELFVHDPAELRPLAQYLVEERPRRVREPGQFSTYSNYSLVLTGAILQQVDGRPWADIVDDEILKPLGMAHSSAREPYPARAGLPAPMSAGLASNLANGYHWTAGGYQKQAFEYATQVAPAGAISSTAADMANYMRMLLNDGTFNGARIFGAEAAKAFRTPTTNHAPELGNFVGGFVATKLFGRYMAYWHDGGTLTFFSDMLVIPELRLGIFVTTNSEGGSPVSHALPLAIIANFYQPPPGPPRKGSSALVKNAAAYAGNYLTTRRKYGGLEGLISRFQPATVSVTPDGHLLFGASGLSLLFAPTDDPSLFVSADSVPGPIGALEFEMKDGRAVAITTPDSRWERLGTPYHPATFGLAAGLALLASLLVVAGLFARWGRRLPQTRVQAIADQVQTATAILWFVSFAGFAAFLAGTADIASIFYNWPPLSVRLFSWAALLASLLTLATLALLPMVWRTNPSTEGWSLWRKLRFSATELWFLALAGLLVLWGALQPWTP